MGSCQKVQASKPDKKCCSDCKTTKTPLWRYGPSGPKTLCNACGITHSKSVSELKKGKIGKSKNRKQLKMNVMTPLEEESSVMEDQKQSSEGQSQRQWGEVERAALLLMAFSCGAVFY